MADIPADYVIQASGDYDIAINAKLPYLLTLKTTSPEDGTASVSFNNGVDGAFIEADDPDFLGSTGISEKRLMAPSTRMRITLDASFTDPIQVTLLETPR